MTQWGLKYWGPKVLKYEVTLVLENSLTPHASSQIWPALARPKSSGAAATIKSNFMLMTMLSWPAQGKGTTNEERRQQGATRARLRTRSNGTHSKKA